MKESPQQTQNADTDSTQARPSWQFSGRRGTPVHKRDQATATLPAEIRSTVTQLARERSGETNPPAGTPSARATAGPLRRPQRTTPSTPPVAGAPLPVERRSGIRTGEQPAATTTFPMPAAPPLVALPAPPAPELADPVVAKRARSPLGPPSPATPHQSHVSPQQAVTPEATIPPVPHPASVPVAPQANDSVAPPVSAATEPPSETPAQAPMTAAERKQRAKLRVKLQRERNKTKGGTAKRRRLFARDKQVTTAEAEPAVLIEAPLAASTVEAPTTSEPALPAPSHAPAPAGGTPSPTPVDLSDAPAPTHMTAGHLATPAPAPIEPVRIIELPAPIAGRDAAQQAAWELGKLPILTSELQALPAAPQPTLMDIPSTDPSAKPKLPHAKLRRSPKAAPSSPSPAHSIAVAPTVPTESPVERAPDEVPLRDLISHELLIPSRVRAHEKSGADALGSRVADADPAGRDPAPEPPTWELAADRNSSITPPKHELASLAEARYDPSLPDIAAPALTQTPGAIDLLGEPLHAPRSDRSTRSTSDVRRRIAERRAAVDDVVAELAGLRDDAR